MLCKRKFDNTIIKFFVNVRSIISRKFIMHFVGLRLFKNFIFSVIDLAG